MAFISIVLSVETFRLFLAASAWWIELGGIDEGQVSYLKNTFFQNQSDTDLSSLRYLGQQVVRFKVDIPQSENAPPLAAVAPLLSSFSSMGYSVLSHNDENKPSKNMVYLTWILQKEVAVTSESPETDRDLVDKLVEATNKSTEVLH